MKTLLILLFTIATLCTQETDLTPPADSTSPNIKITFPLDEAKLTKLTTVKIFATDNTEVVKVSFLIDGELVFEDTESPYEYPWDICELVGTKHTLLATAEDNNGNIGMSDLLTFSTNGKYDCANVCGGLKYKDNCGVCDAELENDCIQDCTGEWGGKHWLSDCGCVSKENKGDDCNDCAGVPYGFAFIDECNKCVDGNTGFVENYLKDCSGECDGASEILTYWYDADSDSLGGGQSSEFCNAIVEEGWVLNDEDGDDNCASNIHDCANVCDGTAEILTYWYDSDEDGLGGGQSSEFCNAIIEEGWVLNNDDSDDNCASNIHDCLGVCDGNNNDKDCDGVCFGKNLKKRILF